MKSVPSFLTALLVMVAFSGFSQDEIRHEFHTRAKPEDLAVGNYVVLGAFKSKENAKRVAEEFQGMGFKTFSFGQLSAKDVWYVVEKVSGDIETAKNKRNELSKKNVFKSAWLLTIME